MLPTLHHILLNIPSALSSVSGGKKSSLVRVSVFIAMTVKITAFRKYDAIQSGINITDVSEKYPVFIL